MMSLSPIPPIPATAAINVVVFWGLICFLVALFVLGTTLWVVTSRRIAQKQSQIKEAEQQYLQEEPLQPRRQSLNPR